MASLIILEGPKYSGKTWVHHQLQSKGFADLSIKYSEVGAKFAQDRECSDKDTSFMLGSCVMIAEIYSLGINVAGDRGFLSTCFYHRQEVKGLYFDLWINAVKKWDRKRIYILDSPDYEEESRRINQRNNCSEDSMYSYYYRQEEKEFFRNLKKVFLEDSLFFFGDSYQVWDNICRDLL